MGTPSRQIRSEITSQGQLRLSLATVDVPDPGPNEVTVRIEASPINPSDLGLLLGPADLSTAEASGTADDPVVTAAVPSGLLKGLAARLDQSLPVGNEGAGVVVATGDSDAARALAGKTVSVIGGEMYAQYRTLQTGMCMELPEGTTPEAGASWFVNPFTALGMVETMRLEGHSGTCPHGRGFEPGPDAPKGLSRGRRSVGEHRTQARTGRAPARHWRQARGATRANRTFTRGPHRRQSL